MFKSSVTNGGSPKHKVWVIGLGRTGTLSMCEALRTLGYRRVVHNPRFEQLRHVDAAADNGCTVFYKYLDYKYPGSKFILLTRDLVSWLESLNYIAAEHPVARDRDVQIMRRMLLYETVRFEKEKMVAAYHRHHEDVRRYFSRRPDDLLEMNITKGQGWEVLCPFLELPEPRMPFPSSHKRGRKPLRFLLDLRRPRHSIAAVLSELSRRFELRRTEGAAMGTPRNRK